jgi:hypothetical protein
VKNTFGTPSFFFPVYGIPRIADKEATMTNTTPSDDN